MPQLLQSTRYLVVVGIIALVLAAIAGFIWSLGRAIGAVSLILASFGQDPRVAIVLMEVVDSVLLASVLVIAAVSLYKIFIGELDLPSGIAARNLYELKGKLASIVVIVMALKFLEHLLEWQAPGDTLFFAVAIAAVSAALMALAYIGGRET